MTREEHEKDRMLRKKAHELNMKKQNGNKVYVVYKSQIVKASDIPKLRASQAKKP